MAVTITDTRTAWSMCDAEDWSGPESEQLYTSGPAPKELTGCLGFVISEQMNYAYYTGSSTGMTDTLIYVWVLTQGTIDNISTGGIQIILGDNTDYIGYHVGGSDVAGFRHDTGQVGWQCFVIDTSTLPTTNYTEHAGAHSTLTLTAITAIGAGFSVTSKSLGGTENCFVDAIRHGDGGIRITAGTSGDKGTFSEIADEDESDTSGKAYGIIRELGASLFGVQGPLTFGDTAGVSATYFADTKATVVFEDRNLDTDKYFIVVQGNSTGSTTFQLGTQVGTSTSGTDGCSLICPTGVGASFTATDTDLDYLYLYGSSLTGFNNDVSFSADATNGPNHRVYDCNFVGCGQIDPGQVLFKNNRILDTTDSTTGAILLDSDSTTDWADLTFTSGGTGHAIYITATGTYTFTNFFFNSYSETSLGSNLVSSSGSTDAMVYNNSGGAVTINISGGDNISVRNGASATTTVNNNVTLEINGVVQNTQCYIVPTAGGASLMNESASEAVSGDEYKATESYNYTTSTSVTIRTRELGYLPFETSGTVSSNGLTITAVWQVDPNWKLTISGISITFADANPDTIARPSGSFITDGWLSVMSQVTVEGSTSNDGTYEIAVVTAGVLTLEATETLTGGTDTTGVTLTYTRRASTW